MIRKAMVEARRSGSGGVLLLTPMADVVFLLLVVLLLGQARLYEGQIDISAGQAGPALGDPNQTVFVTVRAGPGGAEYRINDRNWAPSAELADTLRALRLAGRGRVVVDPGEGVTLAEVTRAFDAAEAAGFEQRSILAPPEGP